MKYGWRTGKTTHYEIRRIEDTIIFDSRIKPHFMKDTATYTVFPHLN